MKKLFLFFTLLTGNYIYAQDSVLINITTDQGKLNYTSFLNKVQQTSDLKPNFAQNGIIRLSSFESMNGYKIIIKNIDTALHVPNPTPILDVTVTSSLKTTALTIKDQLISYNGKQGLLQPQFAVFIFDKIGQAIRINVNMTMKNDQVEVPVRDFNVSGIPLIDAAILKRMSTKDSILYILNYYKSDDQNNYFANLDAALNYFSKPATKNAFIVDYITRLKIQFPAYSQGSSPFKLVSQGLSAAGGLDVTNLADGFAKFIVKRTKQELSIAFFDNFRKALDKDTLKDLRTVFPQTFRTLNTIGDEIYMYEAYIQTLRESFEQDLSSLPENLPGIIDNHKAYFDKNPELKAELLSAFYIAQAVQDKQHPGDIIENYPVRDIFDEGVDVNVKASFQTFQLLSTSLKTAEPDVNYWSSAAELKKLTTDDQLLKIYLGLLEQKAKKDTIIFSNKKGEPEALSAIIDSSFKAYSGYRPYLKNLITKVQSLETKIKGLNKTEKDSVLFENYYNIVSNSIELLKYAAEIETLPYFPDSLGLCQQVDKYTDVAQTAADIAIDVNRRNYASAVVNTVSLFNTTIKEYNYTRTHKLENMSREAGIKRSISRKTELQIQYVVELQKVNASLNTKDVNALVAETSGQLAKQKKKTGISDAEATGLAFNFLNKADFAKTLATNKQAIDNVLKNIENDLATFKKEHTQTDSISNDAFDKLLKYGTFMATLVQAKSPDEVETAIEAFAMPTGSARIKRESKFNVSLNAYCGVFAGNENEDGWNLKHDRVINSYGISAPIGIAVSAGICKHSSLSIFASVVDLGAITTFRFENDTTKTLSKIELKDIISPGIFLSWGIPRCPISINAGYQIAPLLRTVTATGNNMEPGLSRISIGICVDIPVLNFYTRPKE